METIKVALEADSKQLTAEFKKARESAEAFGAKTLPLVAANLVAAGEKSGKVSRELKNLDRSSKLSGSGMLQLAQFADDAQYGLRGVLNNVPGLVAGLGGGAGLAGAISLAALAGSKLVPVLADMLNPTEDKEALKAISDRLGEIRSKSVELARERGGSDAKAWLDLLGSEESAIQRQNQALALNVELVKARRNAAGAVAASNDSFDIARIGSDPNLSAEDRQAQTLAVQQRQLRRAAEEKLARLNDDVSAADKEAADKYAAVGRLQADAAAAARQLAEEETKRRALAKQASEGDLARSSLPGAQAAIDNFQTPAGLTGSMQERLAQRQAALDRLVAERDRLEGAAARGDIAAKALGELDGSIANLREGLKGLESSSAKAAEESRKAALARDFARKSAEAEAKAAITIYETEKKKLNLPQFKGGASGSGSAVGSEPFRWSPGEISSAQEERLNRELEASRQRKEEVRRRYEDERIMRGVGPVEAGQAAAFERVRATALASRIPRSTGISAGGGGVYSRLEGPRGLSRTAERIGERDRASITDPNRDVTRLLKEIADSSQAAAKGLRGLGIL